MRYRTLGRTGMQVSVLCLGTMTFGWTTDQPSAFAIMSEALARGLNIFDTANIYPRWANGAYAGLGEEIIGQWLSQDRSRRERVLLATKVRGPMSDAPNQQGLSRRHIVSAVEASLRRLQTDYIDLYQAHWYDDQTRLEETLRAFDDLISAGKVRALGCSNHPAWRVMAALWTSDRLSRARYETLQPHYNLVHRAEFERELQELCHAYGLGVLPYSPLASGFLSGRYRRGQGAPPGSRGGQSANVRRYMARERNYDLLERLELMARQRGASVAQLALAWVVDAPTVSSAIVGASTLEQLRENLGAAELQLLPEERSALDQLSDWRED